jgi:hypothetical protein
VEWNVGKQNKDKTKPGHSMKIDLQSTGRVALGTAAALIIGAGSALAAGTPQGSINLVDFNVALCFHNDTAWSLSKDLVPGQPDPVPAGGNITWVVNAVKGGTTPNEFIVYGYLTVNNGGSGTANLGNIVVNLQKRYNNTWVSAAADIATAKGGDVSGTPDAIADIVAAGSQENPTMNAAGGAGNYKVGINTPTCSVSTSVGTFKTTAGHNPSDLTLTWPVFGSRTGLS